MKLYFLNEFFRRYTHISVDGMGINSGITPSKNIGLTPDGINKWSSDPGGWGQ